MRRIIAPIRARNLVYAALCGLRLGIAYLIRHSTLALIKPFAIVATRGRVEEVSQLHLVPTRLCFVLTIAPDLMYRASVLGSILAVESPEKLANRYCRCATPVSGNVRAWLFSVTGFGPIVLFAPLGWRGLARHGNRFGTLLLSSWTLAFIAFQLLLFLTVSLKTICAILCPRYLVIALSISAGAVWILEGAFFCAAPLREIFKSVTREGFGFFHAVILFRFTQDRFLY